MWQAAGVLLSKICIRGVDMARKCAIRLMPQDAMHRHVDLSVLGNGSC